MAQPAISVVDLKKSYGNNAAVAGVTFDVAEGEVFGLLGPNGAGKTTVIEIMEGYRRRDSGEVRVLGLDPEQGGRQLRLQLGIVLQECAVPPLFSVTELLRLYAGYYPAPRPVDEILELVGLTEKANARVKTLSGGQQRRIDLALGLIGDPRLVFLDEPTTGFDPSARRNAWDLIDGIRKLGKTVVLTTHYMDEAQHLADRICVINAGRVVALDTPEELGGRANKAARIRFSVPHGVDPATIPGHGELADGIVTIETTTPTATLATLTQWAMGRHLELPGLEVTRPSLEDIYLELAEK